MAEPDVRAETLRTIVCVKVVKLPMPASFGADNLDAFAPTKVCIMRN